MPIKHKADSNFHQKLHCTYSLHFEVQKRNAKRYPCLAICCGDNKSNDG